MSEAGTAEDKVRVLPAISDAPLDFSLGGSSLGSLPAVSSAPCPWLRLLLLPLPSIPAPNTPATSPTLTPGVHAVVRGSHLLQCSAPCAAARGWKGSPSLHAEASIPQHCGLCAEVSGCVLQMEAALACLLGGREQTALDQLEAINSQLRDQLEDNLAE